MATPAGAARQEITVENDVVYRTVEGEQLGADVYLPAGEGDRPAVLLVHGGGWVGGDKAPMAREGRMLAATVALQGLGISPSVVPRPSDPRVSGR